MTYGWNVWLPTYFWPRNALAIQKTWTKPYILRHEPVSHLVILSNSFLIKQHTRPTPLSLDGSAASAAGSRVPTISQQRMQAALCWSGPQSESKCRINNDFTKCYRKKVWQSSKDLPVHFWYIIFKRKKVNSPKSGFYGYIILSIIK